MRRHKAENRMFFWAHENFLEIRGSQTYEDLIDHDASL